jgi:EAL domain-containing protein (putative c-di-GMP-specific phosphodiesterase class I)
MLCEISNDRELKTAWFTRALATDGFETWFQPVLDTSGFRILGHECLVRCCDDHFRRGEEVFEAARARNLVPLFDSRAMALSIRNAAAQHARSAPAQHTKTAAKSDAGLFFINMLPGSMADPEISLRPALEALSCSGMKPEDFVFETVDADLVGDSARLRAVHDYIRKLGSGFALDNAGVGPSCFELICDLKPSYVKIDKRLVWNVEQPVCAATIRKVVEVSDRNGVEVIAVGVERPRMVENLWLLGVKVMQGYLFGRPARQLARSALPVGSRSARDLANLAVALAPKTLKNHHSPLFADLD